MNLAFILGTSGELIKIYPVLVQATRNKIPWKVFSTGQSGSSFLRQWKDLHLPEENLNWLMLSDTDLDSSVSALQWFFKASTLTQKSLRSQIGEVGWVIVHGDTLSTLVGALWARRMSIPLAHVEAGLRSHSWLQPFPEEINRRLVSRQAVLHFAPDEWSANNLKMSKVRGRVISTKGNTMREALELTLAQFPRPEIPKEKFVLANIHRFENLSRSENWRVIQKTLFAAASNHPVYLVLHPQTRRKLEVEDLMEKFKERGVHLMERLPFTQFAHWLDACHYLISDGGSNQEECFYLGKPALLLRKTTERQEGLNVNAFLSQLDWPLIQGFLENPEPYRTQPLASNEAPSQIILDSLSRQLS